MYLRWTKTDKDKFQVNILFYEYIKKYILELFYIVYVCCDVMSLNI